MSKYKVSVVVVVYNTEKYLGECLDSIFAQTLDSVELVVVDNASNEATRRVLAEKIAGRENVVCRLLDENVGGATGITIGMRAASGEYLYTMDSDDIVPPGALEALYTAAKQHDCDVVIGRAISTMNNRVQRMRFSIDEVTWSQALTADSLEEHPELMVAPFYWGKLYRRAFMEQHDIRMQDGVLNADRYMVTNALRLSEKTAVIRDVCCIWRRFPDGRSVTGSAKQLSSIRDRMASLTDTAMLFPEGRLRQYALVSNLARVFLPVRSLSDPEIRPEYSRLIMEYLTRTDEQAILESTVLPVRYKAYAWLARRDRFDDILSLAYTFRQKIRTTSEGTFVRFGGRDMGIPDEVLRQRTISRWESISAELKNGTVHIRCAWPDTTQCSPRAVALLTGTAAERAVTERSRPASSCEISGGKGVMTLSFVPDEDTIFALTRSNNPEQLYLESRSGDSVFIAAVPLSASVLTGLASQLPGNPEINPARAARTGAFRRRFGKAMAIAEKVIARIKK